MRHERGEHSFRPRNFAPVKVGDELEVKIEAIGEKGDGIAKKDGFVLFVPSTKEGDQVRIRVTRVLQKVGFAEVVDEKSGNEKTENNEESQEGSYEESSEEMPSLDSHKEENNEEDTEDFGE